MCSGLFEGCAQDALRKLQLAAIDLARGMFPHFGTLAWASFSFALAHLLPPAFFSGCGRGVFTSLHTVHITKGDFVSLQPSSLLVTYRLLNRAALLRFRTYDYCREAPSPRPHTFSHSFTR